MTVYQLANACQFNVLCSPDPDREINGAYIGDLLSWVMGKAQSGNVWITIMNNVNIVAVATLTDVSCILLCENVKADESVIVKRYKETRRKHPLAPDGSIDDGILIERDKLSFLRENANKIIDTSQLLTRELKQLIYEFYGDEEARNYFRVQVQSFGFKYGIPRDADLVFDVRFLPNPFYVPELRAQNGTEKDVSEFVLKYKQSSQFLEKLDDMLTMLIPHYIEEGKSELVIAIGCTGGKHRSVTIAEETFKMLKSKEIKAVIRHRDMTKD